MTTNTSVRNAARRGRRAVALDECDDPKDYHPLKASKNEVAYLYERLKGLAIVKHKKDCLNLPEKRYRRILCKPSASVLRVAQAISNAPRTRSPA